MNNLPVHQIDIWKSATEADKMAALASLAALPSRATNSEELNKAAYYVALDGVTRYGLAEAVKSILQNGLGHAFFPSPPELRGQCDKAMEWHQRQAQQIHRRERENEGFRRDRNDDWKPPTPEQKERAAAVYAAFCKGYEKAAAEDTFKLDPELVAQIPDNPKALIHQRKGKAA